MAYRNQPPPKAPIRHVPRWTWIAGGGTLLAVGVAAAVLPGAGGEHTAGASSASPVTHSARAVAPAKSAPAWPPAAVAVSKRQLGKAWPFKLTTRGYVACVKEHPGAIIFNPGDGPELGRPFALNGTALDAGFRDVPKRIWAADPAISGARKDITPLQDRAPNRCER